MRNFAASATPPWYGVEEHSERLLPCSAASFAAPSGGGGAAAGGCAAPFSSACAPSVVAASSSSSSAPLSSSSRTASPAASSSFAVPAVKPTAAASFSLSASSHNDFDLRPFYSPEAKVALRGLKCYKTSLRELRSLYRPASSQGNEAGFKPQKEEMKPLASRRMPRSLYKPRVHPTT